MSILPIVKKNDYPRPGIPPFLISKVALKILADKAAEQLFWNKTILILSLFCIFLLIDISAAAPANPDPFPLQQPNGDIFQAKQFGDEYIHWIETLDGYTIIKDGNGWWTYAHIDGSKQLASSLIRVDDPDKQNLEKHIKPIPGLRKIQYSSSSPKPIDIDIKSIEKQIVVENNPSGITTNEKVLVILVNFTDVTQQPNHTKAYYDDLIFNRTPGSNSMYNYFDEVSYNQFKLTGTTTDKWYQSSKTMAYYGEDTTSVDQNTNRSDPNTCYIFSLAKEAVQLADPDIDFSQYDSDSDGIVDHVIIVHSGGAQESSSGVTEVIKSHSWSINNYDEFWTNDGITVDGVKVIDYIMVAEGSPLGTFAHEFFHDLGAPDLYDYDNGTDKDYPVKNWDLMGNGCWINSGNTPPHMSGYLKWDFDADPTNGINGWITPITISTTQTVIIDQLESSTGNRLYKVDIPGTNQYFLIENRQQIGYDSYLPESGILIWHIDEDMPANNGAPANPYHRVWLEDPGNTKSKEFAAYSSDDGQTSFDYSTMPDSNQNNGTSTGIRIHNIGPEGAKMLVTIDISVPALTQDNNSNVSFNNSSSGLRESSGSSVPPLSETANFMIGSEVVSETDDNLINNFAKKYFANNVFKTEYILSVLIWFRLFHTSTIFSFL